MTNNTHYTPLAPHPTVDNTPDLDYLSDRGIDGASPKGILYNPDSDSDEWIRANRDAFIKTPGLR